MKKVSVVILGSLFLFLCGQLGFAAEHGGTTTHEHSGASSASNEHGGKSVSEPTAKDIQAAMSDYVTDKSKATGAFEVMDAEIEKTRKLTLSRIHERVGKTEEYYYSCADFKDTETGDLLDLDLDVENMDGKLNVVDVRIHKLNGKERYTYDDKDNRIPISK